MIIGPEGTRFTLNSPYGHMVKETTARKIHIDNGANGTVIDDGFVEFDDFPGVRLSVPTHWTTTVASVSETGEKT